jgi:hypothetical protein
MAKSGTLSNLKYETIDWSEPIQCLECSNYKIRQRRVPKQADRYRYTGQPFDTGSIDINGMISTPSVGGNVYAIIYCDNETSYGMVEFTRNKTTNEIYNVIKKWTLTANNLG